MKVLKDFDLQNKRVLVRCDFNAPFSEKGIFLDDFRLKKTIPTIEYLLASGAKVILMSHLGRPGKKSKTESRDSGTKVKMRTQSSSPSKVLNYSLKPIGPMLKELLGKPVKFLGDCLGEKVEREIKKMKSGEIILLENLRFHKEEKENDVQFAKELAKMGDIYINDAFGASHRPHASIVGVPKYLPSGAGFLLEKEVAVLTNLMQNPKKPLLVIIGGAKAREKAGLINKISELADFVLIGGLIQKEIKEKNIEIKSPEKIIGPIDEIEGKDIGSKTIAIFKEKIFSAKTIFFNGVLGQVEKEEFSKGTEEILKAIAESSAFSVVGGGDMTKVINKLGLIEKFNYVSTGGGAMLEFLSGQKLPGLSALNFYDRD